MSASPTASTSDTPSRPPLSLILKAQRGGRGAAAAATALLLCTASAHATETPPVSKETVAELMARDLVGVPGKEVRMITVTYLPRGASVPHRHDAQVFVYVLEGELTMQVRGAAPVTLRAGQTFYEGPEDIHQVSANASPTAPAKILVFMVKDKAKAASREVPAEGTP